MTVPAGVTRISITGQLATVERFDYSVWVQGGASSLGDVTLIAGNVAALCNGEGASAPLAQTKSLLSTDSAITQVRVYGYDTAGNSATYVAAEDVTTGAGTGTTPALLQQSLVVSLRTARAGRSFRGRIYLPLNGGGTEANHQLGSGIVDAVAAEWITFLGQVSQISVADGPLVPGVVSQTRTLFTALAAVSVDTKPDVQRRRANKLVPAHTATQPWIVP